MNIQISVQPMKTTITERHDAVKNLRLRLTRTPAKPAKGSLRSMQGLLQVLLVRGSFLKR